jgi:signal peptidase I
VLVALAVFARLLLVAPFTVPSSSMRATLQPGDHLLVDRVSYQLHDVRRGDIVVFDGADLFLPGPGPVYVVKRVIGVGGDRIRCCDAAGRVTVNGRALDESGYLFAGDQPSRLTFDVQVPDDRLWLMGDHRSRSDDSRAMLGQPGGGMVPEDRVVGRVLLLDWPVQRWQWLG